MQPAWPIVVGYRRHTLWDKAQTPPEEARKHGYAVPKGFPTKSVRNQRLVALLHTAAGIFNWKNTQEY